ncbi:DEAD/DEAH box helicase [Cytophagaceae bacterium 50C-KIRBA]|uniref:DEAD/DEAH box helicase n=1 Tax=Aquirufa beregesia TaxID=2516556 RepID=A0ABX0EUX6_9BACT|nr:DEAD/DEAH box helicase [Aquirufa beregesia]NGZ43898.1 DEAD/DEAH box helicase [Aquirufa beregesia]
MKISPSKPFQVMYSLLSHECLGYLFEVFVVQLNEKSQLTWEYQTLTTRNFHEFAHGLDERDEQAAKLIEGMKPAAIFEKFNTSKRKTMEEFFLKTFDAEKGEKEIQEAVLSVVEKKRGQVFELICPDKTLFIMGNDGNPMRQHVQIQPEPVEVLFHFMRNEENTHYFPTLKYAGNKLEFQYKDAMVLCDEPAWMLLNQKLYHFKPALEGKKLRPFLNKKFVVIPKNMEEDYFRKFVKAMVARYPVHAKGFEIFNTEKNCQYLLSYGPIVNKLEEEKVPSKKSVALEAADRWNFVLSFQYGNNRFPWDGLGSEANVLFEKKGDSYAFQKIMRSLTKEKRAYQQLKSLGLQIEVDGKAVLSRGEAVQWLTLNKAALDLAGFSVQFKGDGQAPRYFLGKPEIKIRIGEKLDWFDIQAIISFGEFQIPFLKIRQLILQKKKEFHLPDGSIAIIPDNWFHDYQDLFYFSETRPGEDGVYLKRQHFQLVQEWENQDLVKTALRSKTMNDLALETKEFPVPKQFKGTLRPYQMEGYRWMRTRQAAGLGACLADDMGLGKTVQTLCLLQSLKEQGETLPSLLVMPTSLLYNWEMEAKKFTPQLRVLVYSGPQREKLQAQLGKVDLILCSFGMVRSDIDWFEKQSFSYVILDESQAIKNPMANITKAVQKLTAKYRLVMTGTPLENSTMDLWSQMNFVNPGLLGSQRYFKDLFQVPIEKKADAEKKKRLYFLIKPYLLRREKRQVAADLPAKMESVTYCVMSEEQERLYDKTKSFYRDVLLKQIKDEGLQKSRFSVLQGLTKLRQLANHPSLCEEGYEGESGKMEAVLEKLETVLEQHHKVLIFSQFVQHLSLIRKALDERNIAYAYLDGSTSDRKGQVESFQKADGQSVFLISLKAGGVGLNLTAADYVFLLDPWWNPAAEAQAIDRAHRIGQVKTVFTYKFISKQTVEEKILALQQRKLDLANDLVTSDESILRNLSEDEVLDLLS